jgi:hypothetical protein
MRAVTTETYLTPDGYRDFEIRPAVDLTLVSDTGNQNFTYTVTNFTENNMSIQIYFSDPATLSTRGITSDQIKVTFWSSDLLQGFNGVKIVEGQTIQKSIIPQIEPIVADEASKLGLTIGILVAVVIGLGLLIAYFFELDQTPFWLFFNVWQLFLHVQLFNLKIPGFTSAYWREQLKLWTLRNT